MDSSRHLTLRMPPDGRGAVWPAIVATLFTCVTFGSVMISLRKPSTQALGRAAVVSSQSREVVVFYEPSARVSPTIAAGHVRPRRKADASTAPAPLPRDTATTQRPTPTTAVVPERSEESFFPRSPSARLATPREHDAPWFAPPRPRNPFEAEQPLGSIERDSILRNLGSDVPSLALRRVVTTSERDARAKEAMLKMRLTGRILLVPPDNSGGLITSSLPLPLFGGASTRARRQRDIRALEENRARLERLRQRADSLRRSRADSSHRDERP